MKVYKTNVAGWSATEELRKSLVELGFKSGMPNISRGSDTGSFWLFGEDVKKMKEMMNKKLTVCVESTNKKFFITGRPSHQTMHCEFTVASK